MERKANNETQKSLSKVVINWYPGHMAKTKKQISNDLKIIDIVIEILDARIPIASQNPDIAELIKGKKRVIILNKSDLANESQNKKWVNYFESKGIPVVLVDSNSGRGINEAIKKIEEVYYESEEKYNKKGRVGKSIRVMILGIPNVGKSSFINRVAKKRLAQVGNKPGVTRQKQWIRVNENIELLDTPGVLWPKFESEDIGLKLAQTGTIKDDVIDTIEVSFNLLKFLMKNHFNDLINRYKLNQEDINHILTQNIEENEKTLEIMYLIGKKRGAIISGGNVDLEKVSKIILEDFRTSKLGKITLEIL